MNFSQRKQVLRLSYLVTFLTMGILIMGNYLSTRHFFRLDFTKNQEFVLSPSTQKILRELDDIVTVKVFFSPELPPNLVTVRQYVQDILDEFESYGGQRFVLRFLDPSDEAVAEEAHKLGVPSIRMNILSKDKFEVKNGFLGLAVLYGAQHESLPVIEDARTLEYDLVAAIQKLTQPTLPRVGFSTGHNEYPIVARRGESGGDGHVLAHAALQKNYQVSLVDLSDPEALESLNTLIVGGPESAFTSQELFNLDQYLMKGGNLVFLVDTYKIKEFFEAIPLEAGLHKLLEHYGIRLEPFLVLDSMSEIVSFNEGPLDFNLPYPFWIKAVSNHFHPGHPITRQLDTVIFPWISPLTFLESEGVMMTPLIKTSGAAWIKEPPFNLDTDLEPPEATDQYLLAALLEGKFTSFYASARRSSDFLKESDGKGRILIIGNSRFLTDRMVRQYKQNLTFFLNAVDDLTLKENLIDIRSRTPQDRPLLKLSDSERQIIKLAGIFGIPLLVVLYGLLHFIERKHRKIKL